MIISLSGRQVSSCGDAGPGGRRATKTPAIDGARPSGSNAGGRYEPLCQPERSYPHHHHVLAVFIKYAASIKATVTVSELVWTVLARSAIRTHHRL